MTSLGNLVSFRDIINHINRFIFHNIYPQVCPHFKEGGTTTINNEQDSTIFTDDFASGGRIRTLVKDLLGILYNVASYFNAAAQMENAASRITAFDFGAPAIPKALEIIKTAVSTAEGLTTDDKSDVVEKLKRVQSNIEEMNSELKGSGYNENESDLVTRAKLVKNGQAVAETITGLAVEAQLVIKGDILGPRARAKKIKPRTVRTVDGAHLFTQLILPELYFAAPPRCNVIFPDQYYQFSFSRNFMREVSRLMCRGGMGLLSGRRGWQLFGRSYYAPEIRDVNDKLVFLTQDRGSAVLLPHEVHSGIIPKFEWVTDGHRWSVKAAKETGQLDEYHQSGKVGYIQRLANFQFYLHRFSARSISLAGMFNPNLVLGLPALVLDKPMPAPEIAKQLKAALGRRWLPMAYLGKIEMLSHNLSQQGGVTSITMGKCRTHRGLDDEFLGTLLRESKVPDKSFTKRFRTKKILETADSRRVNSNRKSYRELVTTYINTNNKIPDGEIVRIDGVDSETVAARPSEQTVFITAPVLNLYFGVSDSDATDENPNTGEKGLFLPTVFEIDFKQGGIEELRTSAEKALYPGFYSPVYENATIGTDVYDFLLGTKAITDDVVFDAAAQDELLDDTFQEDVRTAIADSRHEFDFAAETVSQTTDGSEVSVDPGTIEEAVDALTMIYGLYRHRGGDLHQFIREYTARPIANIEDILGSQGLTYDDNGDPVLGEKEVEGFHSRAYGDFNSDVKFPDSEGATLQPGKDALHLLYPGVAKGATNDVLRSTLLDKGEDPLPLLPEYDPRGRAYKRVLAYVNELSISRGLLG
jgi:hypothetical protein